MPAPSSGTEVGELPTSIRVPKKILGETFKTLRSCGKGKAECQVLWIGPWETPDLVDSIVHPVHRAHGAGFQLSDTWISEFFAWLSSTGHGVRLQVHTHPGRAFHSVTDDEWPMISTPGFLSLVIPSFAQNEVNLDQAFLAELGPGGKWREASMSRIVLLDQLEDR